MVECVIVIKMFERKKSNFGLDDLNIDDVNMDYVMM